jgi:hypothetical protein
MMISWQNMLICSYQRKIMKNVMKQTQAGLALGLVLLGNSTAPLLAGVPSPDLSLEWRFTTSANPAAPDTTTGVAGVAQATVTPGFMASSWVNSILSADGVWDLGNQGRVTLTSPAGLVGPSAQAREFTVRVVQFYDGIIYNERTTVSVPGATLIGTTETTLAPGGNLGDWLAQETRWEVAAETAVNSIVISGAAGERKGSVIDSVAVQSRFATGLTSGAQLAIRKIGANNSEVQITWSADYAGMVLESADSVGGSVTWATVNQAPQLSGNTYSVTLDAVSAAKFYRLKQP